MANSHTRLSPPHLPTMYKTHLALDWDSPFYTPTHKTDKLPHSAHFALCPRQIPLLLSLAPQIQCNDRCIFKGRWRRRWRGLGLTTRPSARQVGFIFIAVYRKLIQEQLDEREAFQRMQRLNLGSYAPMHANLGRYYEPFDEIVAPISQQALDYALPPISSNTSAPSEAGVPTGLTPLRQFLEIEDLNPVQTIAHLPQVLCPRPIRPGPILDYPASPSGTTASPVEREGPRIGSLPVKDFNSIDGIMGETEEFAEDTEDEYRYTESTDEEAGPGPSNRRGKRSIRRRREESAPYSLRGSTSKGPYKSRVVCDDDDFPHPSIPNPGGAREHAEYNAGKHKWWSQRVLRPLLSASPKPLSKDAILSIIRKDLGLEGDAWKAFHDQHLVRGFRF